VDVGVVNPSSGVRWWARALVPASAGEQERVPAVVVVQGGSGAGSSVVGRPEWSRYAAAGYVVVLFDADGRGLSGGAEDFCGTVHQDGLRALILEVAGLPQVDAGRIGLYTQSFGITMGSGVLARYPELPVRWLLDWEGPADRTDTGHCDAANTGHIEHDCADDAWWEWREAARAIRSVQVPYLRMQTVRDHAQPDHGHALRMINGATAAEFGGEGVAPWTRVNDADMNLPNQTYTTDAPPTWLANGSYDAEAKVLSYWAELFTLNL